MARLTVDLELEQVRVIARNLDSTLDPVGFARLHGGVNDVYRIDLAAAENPLVLKIYDDEPACASWANLTSLTQEPNRAIRYIPPGLRSTAIRSPNTLDKPFASARRRAA